MERKPLKRFAGLIATALVTLVLISCKGSDGRNGTDGKPGTDGTPGNNATTTLAISALTPEQWAALKPTGRVIGTPVLNATGPLSVTFEIKDAAGNRLTGLDQLKSKSLAKDRSGNYALLTSYPNLAFALAKLTPEDSVTKAPSKWVNYFVTSVPAKKSLAGDGTGADAVPAAPTRPTTDNTGTLVQNADGTYTYTFYRDLASIQTLVSGFTDTATSLKADLGNVSYEATRIHRLVIQFYGNMPGTGTNPPAGVTTQPTTAPTAAVAMANPINVVFDWVPSTGAAVAPTDTTQREIVATAKCNECHDKIGTTTPHGGRIDTRYCVVCHNDQRKFGFGLATAGTTTTYTGATYKFAIDANTTEAAGDFPVLIHKMHMGDELTKTGYNYANDAAGQFNAKGYPMGREMCSKCHSGPTATPTTPTDAYPTAQGENWNQKPSRLACGACHDGVDFATGVILGDTATHPVQTDDTACAGCHVKAGDPLDIKVVHANVNLTPHNPTVPTGLVNFKYEISSVTQAAPDVATPTVAQPVVIKFRILSDGGVAGAAFTPVTTLLPAAAGMTNPLTGFTSSPGFLLAWAMPQAGEVATPVDYNNLSAAGVPVASNHQPYSVSIAALLDTAKTATDGTLSATADANGTYTATIATAKSFPVGAKLRSVALQSYFVQIAPAASRHAIAAFAYVTGESRRKAIEPDKCSNCHEWFEGHGGQRVKEVQVCVMCHVPGLVTSGRGMTNAAISTAYNSTSAPLTADQKAALSSWTGVSFATDPTAGGANPDLALKFPQTSNNFKDMLHGIHMAAKRTTTFKDVRGDRWAMIDASKFVFPGIINNCTDCHTYNGYSGVPANTLATREEAINPAGNTTAAAAKAAIAAVNSTDLMTTPFTSSCVSCHDATAAQAHMRLNGGQIKVARTSLNTAGESCAVCHGAGSTYDPVVVHM